MTQPPAGGSAESHRVLRLLALLAVSLGVVVLAAAAFVLSYGGIHAVALDAGISKMLARIYPPMFDAILVIAGAAVLSLRGAGWLVRAFAWLSLLVLLAAAAAADVVHATSTNLPHRTAAATAAIVPWALLLLGFFLLLAMLRHARLRRAQVRPPSGGRAAASPTEADTVPGTVPGVAGALLPAATAVDQRDSGPVEDDWPGGEFPNGRPRSVASTGYKGDVLVAGRPEEDDAGPGADGPGSAAEARTVEAHTIEPDVIEPDAAEPAGAGAGETADPFAAATVPAQARAAHSEAAQSEQAPSEAAEAVPATGGPDPAGAAGAADEPSQAGETTAGIPLRWPGRSRADQAEPTEMAESAESPMDDEPGQDDPVSDEGHPASRPGVLWVPRARQEPASEIIRDDEPRYPSRSPEPATSSDIATAETATAEAATAEAATDETAPAGTAPAGTAPAGTAPAGTAPPETAPDETPAAGTQPEASAATPEAAARTEGQPETSTATPETTDRAESQPEGSTAAPGTAARTEGQPETGYAIPETAEDAGAQPEGSTATSASTAGTASQPQIAAPETTGRRSLFRSDPDYLVSDAPTAPEPAPGPAPADEPAGPPGSPPTDRKGLFRSDQGGARIEDAPPPATPVDQPAKPAVTSFWDSVFGPRTRAGRGDSPAEQPSTPGEPPAERHPATQPGEATEATEAEEPQFDRFRSSPTPPEDE